MEKSADSLRGVQEGLNNTYKTLSTEPFKGSEHGAERFNDPLKNIKLRSDMITLNL